MLIIKNTKKYGRGVFTQSDIKANTLIDIAPLIVIKDKTEIKHILNGLLGSYVYAYGPKDEYVAIAGGVGSFFNHSEDNNVYWKFNTKKQQIQYYSNQDIKAGQQLFLNYGYNILRK